jgi:transposase
MPWSEPMAEKREFVNDALSGLFSISELCERHQISRKTGYKYLRRYKKEGPEGLLDRSRRPKHCPHQVSDAIVNELLHTRDMHPRWGASKLLSYLKRKKPEISSGLPCRSTTSDLLKRNGRVRSKRLRRSRAPSQPPRTVAKKPNDV